jgi:hypothetical protein
MTPKRGKRPEQPPTRALAVVKGGRHRFSSRPDDDGRPRQGAAFPRSEELRAGSWPCPGPPFRP